MPIIEYVTILHLFYVLFLFNPEVYEILAPQLGSCTTCIGRPSLNPWTSREVPQLFISISISSWIFYYTLSYNPILINYVALIVLYLETASSFSCLTCPFDISNMIFFFLLSTSWTLDTTRNSMFILYIYCASLELQEALVVYWRVVLETKSFVLGVILF